MTALQQHVMIAVDPVRFVFGVCVISTIMFFMGLLIGRRLGFAEGASTWRKSYLHMTPEDIATHKQIIKQMDAALPAAKAKP